jgi:hypothetical protein
LKNLNWGETSLLAFAEAFYEEVVLESDERAQAEEVHDRTRDSTA